MASWLAVCKPTILLNARWNKLVGKSYMLFLYIQLIVFLNVVLLDLYKYIFKLTSITFSGGPADDGESTLNIIVRMTQIMIAVMFICLSRLFFKIWQDRQKKKVESDKILKSMKKQKQTTWKDLKK
jgi:amino acid transporter